MLNIVIKMFGGQVYEITDRHTAPRSSSANRYRNDPWYTGSLIRQLPLEPQDWLGVMEKVRRRPLEIFSSHPAEVYDAVTEAVIRGELVIYKLPQLDATQSLRGKNAKTTGLCFVRGPDAHCATELRPVPIASIEAANALLDEIGISEKLFLGELAHKGLYNSYQQRNPMQTALKMLASGEILAYKIPMPPMSKPPKPVEYEDISGPKYQPVPLGPEGCSKDASAKPESTAELAKSAGNSPAQVSARKKIAFEFYNDQGMPKHKIEGHLSVINFAEPVEIVTLPKGKNVTQYQVPNGPQGNYYANPGTPPDKLGISDKAKDWGTGEIVTKEANSYETNGQVTVLKSTASKIDDTWSIPGSTISTSGGDTQFFTMSSKMFTKK